MKLWDFSGYHERTTSKSSQNAALYNLLFHWIPLGRSSVVFYVMVHCFFCIVLCGHCFQNQSQESFREMRGCLQKAYSPKSSILGQKVFEILAQAYPDDSIQILLNLIQLITLGTESNFRRICRESSEQNGTSISETVCPTILVLATRPFRCCPFKISQQIP